METINRQPAREFDGKDLLWLIDEYMKETASRVLPRTVENYTYALVYFRQWWSEVGPTVDWLVRRTTFQEYTRWLEQRKNQQGKNLGYNTVESALRRLKQVFR